MTTYRAYGPKLRFTKKSVEMLEASDKIIRSYEAKGLSMTLRQLYYQFVQMNVIPNDDRQYDNLGKLITRGRRAGLISWTAIEDRTRTLRGLNFVADGDEAIRDMASNFRLDLWKGQPWRPEVWIEKDALVGVIAGICNDLRVDYFSCRGYASDSEMWRAGQRLARYVTKGQRPIIFHLGDHDPSGCHMTVDNRTRIEMFAGVPVMVQRLALNMNQIEELKPPPNPLKIGLDGKFSDARAEQYFLEHGGSSWELDALSPDYIQNLISENVATIRDESRWEEALREEVDTRRHLESLAGTDDED